MKQFRQYVRMILEAETSKTTSREESLKLIQLFLKEDRTMQAIELAEVLPDINPNVLDLFGTIRRHISQVIEYGRGTFSEGGDLLFLGNMHQNLSAELMRDVKELRMIADSISSANTEIWNQTGQDAMILYDQFNRAILAVKRVLKGKDTQEALLSGTGRYGTAFIELAERFGMHL